MWAEVTWSEMVVGRVRQYPFVLDNVLGMALLSFENRCYIQYLMQCLFDWGFLFFILLYFILLYLFFISQDISEMPNCDLTRVKEKGWSLSGGKKRTVYLSLCPTGLELNCDLTSQRFVE